MNLKFMAMEVERKKSEVRMMPQIEGVEGRIRKSYYL